MRNSWEFPNLGEDFEPRGNDFLCHQAEIKGMKEEMEVGGRNKDKNGMKGEKRDGEPRKYYIKGVS